MTPIILRAWKKSAVGQYELVTEGKVIVQNQAYPFEIITINSNEIQQKKLGR